MNELQITELNGQRVLTTQQIADGYGTTNKVISNNFNNNRTRFEEGKHFILLVGEYLKEFLHSQNLGTQNKIRKLYLWTEKGALLHAKSLGTDEDKLGSQITTSGQKRNMVVVNESGL